MADPIKRLHYFDHQFLRENDFTVEQKYHIEMRRRHNRVLHTFGIAEGLEVPNPPAGATGVTITEGTAYDAKGQEIVLASNRPLDLQSLTPGADVFITIAYREQETNPTTETGAAGNTRFTEDPLVEPSLSPPANLGEKLVLARVSRTGTTINNIDRSGRRAAGVVAGDLEVRSLTLTDPNIAPAQWSRIRMGAAGRADVQSSLRVAGNLDVTGTVNGRNISADGTKLDTHGGITSGNPHGTTAAQVGALPVAGGALTGNLQVNGNIGVTGTVDGRDVLADGAKLDAHVGITSGNPHGTTAAQVGALPITGGILNGDLRVGGDLVVSGFGSNISTGGNVAAVHASHGNPNAFWGVLAFVTPSLSSNPGAQRAAVAGVADIDGVFGVYARAKAGTHALNVNGTANFSGAKTGYVVDLFVNASGQKLHTGDVVKLKGTPVKRFQGDQNKIPVAEVSLCDRNDDNQVIGIVDREALPDQDRPDPRVEPEDPTSIADGGELFVVTLGTYAHCKVDATEAPIEVGDLLTSSAKPGHAKKATDPKLGTIIGKALEPLKEGAGYIAVFVNIQ